ncbi:MAG: hypothetical protein WBX01_09420 [Nitrososphaeraceae archaeon]
MAIARHLLKIAPFIQITTADDSDQDRRLMAVDVKMLDAQASTGIRIRASIDLD